MNVQIVYEDNHLIAVNKPAGVLVQGDETGDEPLSEAIKRYIKVQYDKPGEVFLGVIHRLDRPVSGVVVFARTSKALERMNKLFHDRQVRKTYWAVTAQRPDPLQGKLTHYMVKDHERNIAKALERPSNRHKDAKYAELDYEMIMQSGSHCLLEVHPLTGRPHQIRAQLAKIGCPIRGDVKYGFPSAQPEGHIYLHCRALAFEHPVKKQPVHIEAELPDDPIWRLFADQA